MCSARAAAVMSAVVPGFSLLWGSRRLLSNDTSAVLPFSVFNPPSSIIRFAWFEISVAFLRPFFLAMSVSGFWANVLRNVWTMALFMLRPFLSSFWRCGNAVSKVIA